MGFKKGMTPYNKLPEVIFYKSYFIYNNKSYYVDYIKDLYLVKNIHKNELFNILQLPKSIVNIILKHYNLLKSRALAAKLGVKNTDYAASVRKVKATKKLKYGDENYNNRDKAKQTCIERFGIDNIYKSEKFKHDMILLNQQKYGCDYNSQAQEVKDKKKNTCLQKFGTDCPLQSESIKEKIKQTNLKNLGVEYPTQSSEVMAKQQKTNEKRYNRKYGFDYEKSKQYYLDNYGTEYYTQTLEYHSKAKKHYTYNNESFDSFPELCVYIYAKENNISIERCPIKFKYIYNKKIHYYIPDFKYNGILIEIKGNHFFHENIMINPYDRSQDELYEAKHQCGLKHGVVFWKEDDYKFAINYFKDRKYRREDYED